ncbi:interference hedgehog-like isoform X1 [Diachasmimorpha longicaudata]|uniref:interference hedgehog-like isoform X1 n=1 Tax=Diachasmimorpha longicaudata TaxID=58733 RepID=UPI0030B8DAB9
MLRISLTLHSALALLFLIFDGSNASGPRQELGMQFTRHPQPLAAPVGDVVDFECSLNLAADKFTWRHRPLNSNRWSPLPNPNANPGVRKTSKLVVNFDDPSKAGDYRCIAYYGTSGLASDSGRLSLAKIDQFTDKSDLEIMVPSGNTVPITCPVPFSSPDSTVQFFKDNIPIKSTNLVGGKTIVLENAQPLDSGSYHCAAYNDIATQTVRSNHKTKLNIHKDERMVPPFFVKQPQTEYKIMRGRNVTLECFGAAYPIPKVTWSRLAGNLPFGFQYTPSGLVLINVQPQDRGEYHCMWTSNAHKIESVIILKVVEAPRVTRGPKASTFSEGGELELSCGTSGQPEPTIEWLINGEPLQRSPNIESKGSTLFVSSVEKKHAGIVQCVASNEYGSHSGYNLLRVNPKQHPGGSGDHSKPESHGIPGGVHKHTRMGGKRKSKEGHRRGTVLVPPNQPNVTRLSDVSVMVRWSVPENTGLPIQFFKVQYKEFGSKASGKQSKWMTANMEIANHVRSFEVTDLQTNSFYRFRIAAVYSNNDNKLSPNSVKFHLTKMEGFDTNKMPIPLLTNTEALGADRVLLIWQNPDRSVDIDGFYVNHRASTTAGDYIKTTVEGKNSTNITISHLQPDTTYEFKVQSFSVGAASEFSKIIREKTLKAVTEPPRVEQTIPDNVPQSTGSGQNGSLYAIIGGALGGATLLGVMGAIVVIYKRSSIKQNRDASQNQGKHMTNGRVLNGGITDSKINITSNPLAVLDTSETTQATNNMNSLPKSGQYSSMEMTSFVNGQNNNTSANELPAGSGPNSHAVRSDASSGTLGSSDHHV